VQFFDKEDRADYNDVSMRVGLVSDTHIPDHAKELPEQLKEAFHGVDLILHAGDIYIPSVLDDLERIAPVLAARGDDDYGGILTDERVKEKHILELEGQTLWLVHTRPYYLMSPEQQSRLSSGQDKNSSPDIIVFGHEHRTDVQRVGNILFVNSGSPTFLNYLRGPGTVGILDIDSGEADVRILRL